MCAHIPDCPTADARETCAARAVAPRPEQGWCLLCNGLILFDDGHAILPHGSTHEPVAA